MRQDRFLVHWSPNDPQNRVAYGTAERALNGSRKAPSVISMLPSLRAYPKLAPPPKALQGSLGARILIALAAVWVVLLIGLNLVLRGFVEPTFIALEQQLAMDDIARVQGALAQDLETLGNSSKDYATWDDMYEFVNAPTKEFAERNLAASVFDTIRIDLLFVFDKNQNAVHAGARGMQVTTPALIVESQPEVFKARFPLLCPPQQRGPFDSLKRAGTVRLKDGRLMEVIAVPILKSDGQGPVAGTVVMGRIIDEKMIDDLKRRTRLEFQFVTSQPVVTETTDEQPSVKDGRVLATATLYDPFRQPIAKLRLSHRANISDRGQQTLTVASLSTLAVLSVGLLILLILLNVYVVVPVSRLAQTINTIHTTGDLNTKIQAQRNDEIGFLAQSFERLIALLGHRAQTLEYLATSDELTSLYNRRYTMDLLHHEVERAFRYGDTLGVMMIDVDHFKRINDTAGHAVGDRVLRNLARVLKETMRDTDCIGRYGGEEFLIVMPHQTQEGALIAAERVRRAVEKSEDPGLALPVTVSIGVALWQDHTREALLYIADQNMYRAKAKGRNRVIADIIPHDELPKHSQSAIKRRAVARESNRA